MANRTDLDDLKKSDVYDIKRGFLLGSRNIRMLTPQEIADRVRENNQPRMSDASSPAPLTGLIFSGGNLVLDTLTVLAKQDFNDAATPWERTWSSLCKGGGDFTPVLVETTFLRKVGMGTVAGHRGKVGHELLIRYGNPTVDPKTGWMGGDGLVFVADPNDQSLPPGQSPYGVPQTVYDVLTSVDGQVLAVFGTIDREALEEANWIIDVVLAPLAAAVLVKLAVGAARLCTSLLARMEERAARNLLAGPGAMLDSGALAKAATGLDFKVLAEGPAIPGTSVPEWLRLRVGRREFNITRNAAKIEKGTGQPIGPATKHLAEEVKGGPWNDLRVKKGEVIHETTESNVWLRQNQVDFPMSSLASGLQVAEREIMKGALVPLEGSPGVYKVLVDGWEFMINTNKAPWVVYHALIK
jgi:hypothetical protein